MKCTINFNDHYIDSLLFRLQESSEKSINNQINLVLNSEVIDFLKVETKINRLSCEDKGMRKSFIEYLKASNLEFKSSTIEEFYLIETESEGEIFVGTNYLYLICNGECMFLEFLMEYGVWRLLESKKCDRNIIADYFKDVNYQYECNSFDQTTVSKLIVSYIENKSITTKYLTTVCQEDMPPIPNL